MISIKELFRTIYLRYVYFKLNEDNVPISFRRCWEYKYKKINSLKIIESFHSHGNIIFYPMNDWHTRTQRSQQIASSFCRIGYNSIYINPHLGRQFKECYISDRDHRLSVLEEGLFELHVRLLREPVFHHRMLFKEESKIIANAVRDVLSVMQNPQGLQIVSLPIWLDAAIRIRQQYGYPILYDCHDLLEGFSSYADDIRSAESTLLEKADILIFSSSALLEHHIASRPEWAAKSTVVRNAINETLLEMQPQLRPRSANPVVGYVGAIEEWFDAEAVRIAAAALPGCRFKLFGRLDNDRIRKKLQLPNIEFKGEVEFSRLPEVLAEFDIGLIPFKINQLTLSTNPIKLYEYFGFGMPVVSSALPEVVFFGPLAYIASSPSEFAEKIQSALSENNPDLRNARQNVARHETWSQRALEIIDAVAGWSRRPSKRVMPC